MRNNNQQVIIVNDKQMFESMQLKRKQMSEDGISCIGTL